MAQVKHGVRLHQLEQSEKDTLLKLFDQEEEESKVEKPRKKKYEVIDGKTIDKIIDIQQGPFMCHRSTPIFRLFLDKASKIG